MTQTAASAPKIGTHHGAFHCDEVLACHMLSHTKRYAASPIVRTRDPALLAELDIVVDVGAVYDVEAARFDHHQRGFSETFAPTGKRSRTKLSSAGLIYKHFGREIVCNVLGKKGIKLDEPDLERVYLKVYDSFLEAIDAIDNGISQFDTSDAPRYESSTDLSSRVSRMNAEWYEENPDQDVNFKKAVLMAGAELDECIAHIATSWLPARSIIAKGMAGRMADEHSGAILVLREWAPWKDHLFTIEEEEREAGVDQAVKYVVYKDITGGTWRVQCVPVIKGSFESRKALPEVWRGIRDEDLSALTGIPNCIFVHASGFIGGNKDFEGAMQMAKASLAM